MVRHPVVTEDLERIVAAPLPWDQLADATVLVSGAAGFLPAYLVETLLYLNESRPGYGLRVVGLVRDLERAAHRFEAYAGRDDLALLRHDVSEPLRFEGRVDVVIHAASQASPVFYDVDPVGTLEPNVLGTHHLLERARADEARGFLFFSSGEVYGRLAPEDIPTREDRYGYLDPTLARSCYGESKRMGETLCAAYHHQHGVPTTMVRPYHTYGPGLRLDDGRVFADFVADIVAGRPLTMKSDGRATRAFCYLADATLGFLTVLLSGEHGEAYNIGNDEAELSILELARMLGDEFGLEVREQEREAGSTYVTSTISRGAPDVTKARALGWAATTGVREGFARTVATFRAPQASGPAGT